MQSLYTQLTELLDKPLEDDPDFARLVEEIGEKPDINDSNLVCFYTFRQTGLQITAIGDGAGTSKSVASIIFFLDVPSVREGSIKRYCGQFMAGVTPYDSMDEVKRKIELMPADLYAADVPQLHYDFPDYSVNFHFHELHGNTMSLVSLRPKKKYNDEPQTLARSMP
jgi:hypothetical protein